MQVHSVAFELSNTDEHYYESESPTEDSSVSWNSGDEELDEEDEILTVSDSESEEEDMEGAAELLMYFYHNAASRLGDPSIQRTQEEETGDITQKCQENGKRDEAMGRLGF